MKLRLKVQEWYTVGEAQPHYKVIMGGLTKGQARAVLQALACEEERGKQTVLRKVLRALRGVVGLDLYPD